jgi:hypothetical protein
VILLDRGLLDDPGYHPKHPPINGRIPAVVHRFGPRTQIRWFSQYRRMLRWPWPAIADQFYLTSLDHTGLCCHMCEHRIPASWQWNPPRNPDVTPCCCRTGDNQCEIPSPRLSWPVPAMRAVAPELTVMSAVTPNCGGHASTNQVIRRCGT